MIQLLASIFQGAIVGTLASLVLNQRRINRRIKKLEALHEGSLIDHHEGIKNA